MKRVVRISLYVLACVVLVALIVGVNLLTMAPKLLDAHPERTEGMWRR